MAILCFSILVSIIVALAHCSVSNDTRTSKEKLAPEVSIQVQNLFASSCENTTGEMNSIRNTLEIQNQTFQSMSCSLEDIYDITNKTNEEIQSQNVLVQDLSITIDSINSRLVKLEAQTEEAVASSKNQDEKLQGLTALLEAFINSELNDTHVADKVLTCPEDFKEFQGNCYTERYEDLLPWYAASEFCKTKGGFLAEPRTNAENDYLTDVYSMTWLGGSDRRSEGEWIWSTDAIIISRGFTSWYPGQPSSDNAHKNDCLVMDAYSGGWISEVCGALHGFVCQTSKS